MIAPAPLGPVPPSEFPGGFTFNEDPNLMLTMSGTGRRGAIRLRWSDGPTGPDLARVGGKYSNDWHAAHMADPRSVVPESIMPGYAFMAERLLDASDVAERLATNRAVGVPYSDEMIENALADLEAQADPEADTEELLARYPKAAVGDFDGDPARLTEMDAIIAYLQILGRMVDFTDLRPEDLQQ